MKKYMKYFIVGCFAFFAFFLSVGANTHWECDIRAYQYDMSMYISVHQKGVELDQWTNLELAAFSGNECRGVATVGTLTDGSSYYYLRVRSNAESGETISFKVYDKTRELEREITETVNFQSLQRLGFPSDPFVVNLPFISVTSVSLNKASLFLETQQTEVLTATVLPTNASDIKVLWSSSNEEVATVNQSGRVTALKAGTVAITATSEDEGKTATCELTVIQRVTGISLNKSSLTLNTSQTETLVATVSPADASDKEVSWLSSDPAVATVGPDGTVTALKAGTSVVSVTTNDGEFAAECNLTVLQPVTGITINKETLTLNTSQTQILTAAVSPSDASNKNVTWSSSNTSVATVDQEGIVTALKAGTATITVTTLDGDFTASCTLTVRQSVTGVELNKTEMSLKVGESETLTATIVPEDAYNKSIEWKTSDQTIATVDQEGRVTAVKAGTAVISVVTEDGDFEAECTVAVIQPVTGITLNKTELTLTSREKETIIATVNPLDASNKNVSWSSSDESIARVNQEGEITTLKGGTAVIKVTTEDGGFAAECSLTVIQLPTGVYLTKTELSLKVTEEETLEVLVEPEGAQFELKWTSSDETIATVDPAGKVTALKAGVVIIKVETDDEEYFAECEVTVIQPVTGISLNKTELQLEQGQSEVLIATITPEDASDKTVKWESSDENIAVVDQEGIVTALSKGNTTITVTSEDRGLTAVCDVEVIEPVGIKSISKEPMAISYTGVKNMYKIRNVPFGSVIRTINLQGQIVKTFNSGQESTVLLSLEGMPSGVYIIQVENEKLRISKQ